MSDGEHALVDTKGKFVQVVSDGRKRNDIEWLPGRILLSNKRLVLATNDGKRTIPLSKVSSVTASQMNQPLAQVDSYVKVQAGRNVTLISAKQAEEFQEKLYSTLLDQTVVLVNHPAVKGGVVQDGGWEKGRLKLDGDCINLAIASGTFVELDIDDVGTVEAKEKTIRGDGRPLLEVEHTIEGTSVETHISGTPRHVSLIEGLVRQGEQRNIADDVDLSDKETQVLMALYSGISPFKIPDFVDMEIEEVEDVYDRLMEADILEPVRTRREVQLEARGRSIASDAMADQ
ncbi:chemotaxis protein CheF1 [Haloarcula sp. CBA1130]|uniref:CheF family chemotaxis protein n=1 Tax=unclassified Haloarcula TaxID=2624677 RepID=UPI001244B8D0|nr:MULTISPECIES: CheF family chemotaxis protein [unclassified Haloarcula]KAA9399813.1 chemotaxis protein CheF1 [Haloarcula sp. CBA1129]KAA9401508.1 chemotaxis protein CheF1 [Haloarcula sp. CBA1130]